MKVPGIEMSVKRITVYSDYKIEDGFIFGDGDECKIYDPADEIGEILKDLKRLSDIHSKMCFENGGIEAGNAEAIAFCRKYGLFEDEHVRPSAGVFGSHLAKRIFASSQEETNFWETVSKIHFCLDRMDKPNELPLEDREGLMRAVNTLLENIQLSVSYLDYVFLPKGEYNSLKQAIGLHFLDALFRGSGMGTCAYPICAKPFKRQNSKEKYCNDWDRDKYARNPCENKHRRMLSYKPVDKKPEGEGNHENL